MNAVMNQRVHPRPCEQLSAYQGLHVLSYAESALAQMTRAFLVTAKSGHLDSCRRVTSLYTAKDLASVAGRANKKGKPDPLTRFRHYHLNKLGNATLEAMTTANMTTVFFDR